MRGTIGLRGLQIRCIVGIHSHERQAEQPLIVDIEIERDFAAAAASDSVADTVDYDEVAAALGTLARERQYQLIETFAEEGAALLLRWFPDVQRVLLTVSKPDAITVADAAFVRVERDREP